MSGLYQYNPFTPNVGDPSTPFTGTTHSLDYWDLFGDTSLSDNWYTYFDAYDPKKEEMLVGQMAFDIGQLEDQLGLESKQLGEAYQHQLGSLFDQAGTGTMDLMSSWAGGGQAMTGRKRRQRQDIRSQTATQASQYGLGLKHARDKGKLSLESGMSDLLQGLERDVFSSREDWQDRQRQQMLTMLGWDIYDEQGNTGPAPNRPNEGFEDVMTGSEQTTDSAYGKWWEDEELQAEKNPDVWEDVETDCSDPMQQANPDCADAW